MVTGIGAVTPLGTGRQELWAALLAGKLGFAPVESFDTSPFSVHLGAEVRRFSAAPYVRTLDPARLGRASQLAIAAARLALADAGLGDWRQGEPWGVTAERAGVALGTTAGESERPSLYLYRFDAGGSLLARRRVPLARPVAMHDFCLAPRHAVFHVGPYSLDLRAVLGGGAPCSRRYAGSRRPAARC